MAQQQGEMGKKTGQQRGGQHSGGNFKNDPARAAEAGRKGGQSSGASRSSRDEEGEDQEQDR